MKRLLTIVAIAIGCVLGSTVQAQTLVDFNKNHTSERLYDDEFNPILKLTLKNISSKTITSIEVSVEYANTSAHSYARSDWTNPIEKRIVKIEIKTAEKKTTSIQFPKEVNGKNPNGFWVSMVRYSDGTICDK